MIKYVLKSGGQYVKSTRYSTKEFYSGWEDAGKEVGLSQEDIDENIKEFKKSILEEQVFTPIQSKALMFDSLDELNSFFDRNMDTFLKNEYEYYVETVYIKS